MSTPWLLHRLYALDTSSLDFLRSLYPLIRHDEKEQYLISLQGPELTRLVVSWTKYVPSLRLFNFHQFMKYSTGPQCHPYNRQCGTKMSTRAASKLRSPRDPTILVHHI